MKPDRVITAPDRPLFNPAEVQAILAKYPPDQKRAAVMPLLYLAQNGSGFVTKGAMEEIASILEITPTEVASIVGFYSLYYDEPAGKYRIQVCNDLPCALRGADQFLQQLCANLGIKVGETTSDGLVTVEAVMCLAGCDRAPLFQVQVSDTRPPGAESAAPQLAYHENQTVNSAMALIESWRNPSGPTPTLQPATSDSSPSSLASNPEVMPQEPPAPEDSTEAETKTPEKP